MKTYRNTKFTFIFSVIGASGKATDTQKVQGDVLSFFALKQEKGLFIKKTFL